jgi:hypothetical protein
MYSSVSPRASTRNQLVHQPFGPQVPLQHCAPVVHVWKLERQLTQWPVWQRLLQHLALLVQNSPVGRHEEQVLVVMPQNFPQQSLSFEHGRFCVQHTPLLQTPAHAPQVPPQPSEPQVLPAQLGTH